jgi:threonine dehydrogenase-like Zn-dependent dehydrogenase
MDPGFIMGHEAIGIVDVVGPSVKNFRVGDRVVISAVISCGSCDYCQRKEMSLCDRTNSDPDGAQEKLYGHRLGGLFGYSKQLGGFDGCQASHVRVPIADVNLLKIPASLPNEQAICLADIACTAWHGNELANVQKDDTVVVWGCGPVGLLIAYFAKFRGAKLVVSIDEIPYRLQYAKEKAGADIVIDRSNTDVVKKIQELIPGGPDKCIDASAFRYARSLAHKAMRAVGLETDTSEVVNEMITVCRKGKDCSSFIGVLYL